jgi:sulfoxide reductase heme-binding subunit YedZ
MPSFSRSSVVLCLLLTLPAVFILAALANGETWRVAIRPSGDFAAKLLVVTLSITPLRGLFPQSRWTAWLMFRRRILGLSAFFYALFHLAVFCASIGRLDWIVEGMAFASMWTGWVAFALLAAVAAISNAGAMRRLGLWWKRIQRLAHPAAALALAHWLLLTASPWEALAHGAPTMGLWVAVAARRLSSAASAANNRKS